MSEVSDSHPPSQYATPRKGLDDEDVVPTFVPPAVPVEATVDMHQQFQPLTPTEAALKPVQGAFSNRTSPEETWKPAAQKEEEEEAADKENLPVFVPTSARSGYGGYVPGEGTRKSWNEPEYSPAASSPDTGRSYLGRDTSAAAAQHIVDPNIIRQLCSLLNPSGTPPESEYDWRHGPAPFSERSDAFARSNADELQYSPTTVAPTVGPVATQEKADSQAGPSRSPSLQGSGRAVEKDSGRAFKPDSGRTSASKDLVSEASAPRAASGRQQTEATADVQSSVSSLPLAKLPSKPPVRSPESSEPSDNAFAGFSRALLRGADALVDSGSERSWISNSSKASWERAMPRRMREEEEIVQIPEIPIPPRRAPSSKASQPTDVVITGRDAQSLAFTDLQDHQELGFFVGLQQDAFSSSSNTGALTQQLLRDMQAQMRRPNGEEISAMAARIASSRKMTKEQELLVQDMLREIADALFGEAETPGKPPLPEPVSGVARPPQAPGKPTGSIGASSGSRKRQASSASQGGSQLHTARSSVASGRSLPSAASISDEAASAAGTGENNSEVLDQEVHGLLFELYGNLSYEPSDAPSTRSRSSQ